MQVINELYPSDLKALQQRLSTGSGNPVVMVNLLKFRAMALYSDSPEPQISGEQAYGKYISAVKEVLPGGASKNSDFSVVVRRRRTERRSV